MARPSKPASEKLTKVASFRLTDADYAAYQTKFVASGLNQSEFFRRYVLTNETEVIAKPGPTVDKKRLIYLFGKAGNNINQLAHRLNSDHLAGTVGERTYIAILEALQDIERHMSRVIKHVD